MAQDRLYTVSFSEVAVTAAVDLFELTPADDRPIEIIGLFISQSTDFGDAQDEVIPYTVLRGHTTSGSGGGAVTPAPLNRSGAAAGFAAERTNTTPASAGTVVQLHAHAFNVRVGEQLWIPEGCEWEASQADTTLVIRLASAPVDSIDLSATIYVREQG